MGQTSAQADSVNQDGDGSQPRKAEHQAGWRFASQELRQQLVKLDVVESL